MPELFKIAKQAGFTQESFDKCLTDQKLLEELTAGRTRASDVFGVSSTPTFFINGKRLEAPPVEDVREGDRRRCWQRAEPVRGPMQERAAPSSRCCCCPRSLAVRGRGRAGDGAA